MKKVLFLLLLIGGNAIGQNITLTTARFATGDNKNWANFNFVDTAWKNIQLNTHWEEQGFEGYNGYAWYRIHFNLTTAFKNQGILKEDIEFFLSRIDDADISYLNGVEIGRTGRMQDDPKGFGSGVSKERHYVISAHHPALRWDADNVIAIRVYDKGGTGGMFKTYPSIHFLQHLEYLKMEPVGLPLNFKDNNIGKLIHLTNNYIQPITGKLSSTLTLNGKIIKQLLQSVTLNPKGSTDINLKFPKSDAANIDVVFTESVSKGQLKTSFELPYLLTPEEKATPQINNSALYGTKPNVPFLFKIAATGKRPMQFSALHLPKGLHLDINTGIISGVTKDTGNYTVVLNAKNALGTASHKIQFQIGNNKVLVLPPMGWSSWNCGGLSVSDASVRATMNAIVNSGLINHGWSYVNIDDGWEANELAPDSSIMPNYKFPNMKKLTDDLHNYGLKFGIYSSPGIRTCGRYLGSYNHEVQDIKTYAAWGVDYLKYDLCSYRELFKEKLTREQHQYPYQKIHDIMEKSGRNMVLSICQYGIENVWEWGNKVGGNVWRTTGDINDTWISLKSIGFLQEIPASYNAPTYGFGDPDMMVIGVVGWDSILHDSRLTPSEQYTHVSLWSLLSAPLMLGCDLSKMDKFTYNLLSNDEVIAIDQDKWAKGPKKFELKDDVQVWVKELSDGSHALGIFNLSDKPMHKVFNFSEVGFKGKYLVRDVWRQKNRISGNQVDAVIPKHGVLLIKIKKVGEG